MQKIKAEFGRFNFNDQTDFSSETDCIGVAKKLWNWLLNPISFDHFSKEIFGKQVLVIQKREKSFTYSQDDPADDLITLQMVKEFVGIATKEAQAAKEANQIITVLKYGQDINVTKSVGEKIYNINPATEEVEHDLLFSQEDTAAIHALKPHEFSASLAKFICLSNELLETHVSTTASFVPQDQIQPPETSDYDKIVLVFSGKVTFRTFCDSKVWKGQLSGGDLIYIPAGVKNEFSVQEKAVLLTIETHKNFLWKDLITKATEKCSKRLQKQL